MKTLHMVAVILVVVGAINWGLFAFGFNVVSILGGGMISQLVYILIGVSGVYLLLTHKSDCKLCSGKK